MLTAIHCLRVDLQKERKRYLKWEVPILALMKAEARISGRCSLCDARLPKGKGRRRTICGAAECKRNYQNIYGVARRREGGRIRARK